MGERTPVRDVEVTGTIRLGQFLKLSGLVEHGADAKDVVAAGEVTVNGRAETRRGHQLRGGDVVAFAGGRARVADSSSGA